MTRSLSSAPGDTTPVAWPGRLAPGAPPVAVLLSRRVAADPPRSGRTSRRSCLTPRGGSAPSLQPHGSRADQALDSDCTRQAAPATQEGDVMAARSVLAV